VLINLCQNGDALALLLTERPVEDSAAAVTSDEAAPGQAPLRNVFEWHSHSLGVEWARSSAAKSVRVLGWGAACGANAVWAAEVAGLEMTSSRRDEGLLASVERKSAGSTTTAGIRVERIKTSYRIDSDSAAVPPWELGARTSVAAAFARHARAVGPRVEIDLERPRAAPGRAVERAVESLDERGARDLGRARPQSGELRYWRGRPVDDRESRGRWH
jgi:hypothetical protein